MKDATTVIADYRPLSLGQEATEFARSCVAACLPVEASRAKSLLFATGRLGEFCCSVGLELAPSLCLRSAVIERFIATGCKAMSGATRRTLRANLRYVQAALSPEASSPAALSRERAKAPYTEAEIASYLGLCDAQPTLSRHHHLGALICLGAGAGLMGNELRLVTGEDICTRSGGVLVTVAGRRPRVVPVLAPYHGRLLDAAAFAGWRYVIGGVDAARTNVTDRLVRVALRTSDLARLDTGRLRSTYLVAMAETIGLKAFMDAAGITCSQRLGDLVASLAAKSEEETVALLRGRR